MPFPLPDENLTGRLLVASPFLAETEFAQAVVYLCMHSPSEGAMGVIINRRLVHPGIEEVLGQLDITPNPPQRIVSLGMGGPVEPGRGFVLHSPDWQGEGGVVTGSIAALSASLDVLRELALGHGPRHAMMLLGHAGWLPGQLEEEIFRGNAWYLVPATEALLFCTDPAKKWESALASIGMVPAFLSATVGEA